MSVGGRRGYGRMGVSASRGYRRMSIGVIVDNDSGDLKRCPKADRVHLSHGMGIGACVGIGHIDPGTEDRALIAVLVLPLSNQWGVRFCPIDGGLQVARASVAHYLDGGAILCLHILAGEGRNEGQQEGEEYDPT